MEEKFLAALEKNRAQAQALGVRIRPVTDMTAVHRCLSAHRESDGFYQLADMARLDLSMEALAVKKQFTALFSDEEANNALNRLLAAGYTF
jgi:hypothetical protein